MSKLYKAITIINLLLIILLLWLVLKQDYIHEYTDVYANWDYCLQLAQEDPVKMAWCDYEKDFLLCWLDNYNNSTEAREECRANLIMPTFEEDKTK